MNLKHLIKFGMEESQEPVIKNPILRQALEPRSMDLAEGGRIELSDAGRKLDSVIAAYRRYRRGEKNPKINFKRFFEIYAKENFADGGRIGFNDGKGVHLDAIGRQNTKSIEKEESLKKIFDKIFDEADWGGIKGEFPGVGKAEQEAGISKYHPTRRGKTGGKIPNQWYSQHVSKAIKGDVDALNDLARITGRSVEDLQGAFGKIEGAKLKVKSEAAAKSTKKLNPKNKELVDLVNGGVTKKADLLDALKVTDDEFQKMVSLMFKQGYENRSKLRSDKSKKITSYLGNTLEDYNSLIDNLNKIDGIDKARERLITSRIQQVYGVDGSHPNSKMFKTMTDRVNEFYKLKKILPKEIVLNLDHAIPMSLIEQLTEANTLRVNVQPITQSLNLGLKAQVDKAYAAAYKAGDKETMRAIEEVANKIDLPMGKITDTFTDLGKNPYLTGDMKQVIYNNLVIQNSISEKAGKLDKELLKKAGLDNMSFDVGKVDTQTVAKLFSEGDEKFTKFVSGVGKKVKSGGKLYSFPAMLGDKELMKGVGKDIGKLGKKGLRFLAKDWVWPEVLIGAAEGINLYQKGAEPSRAWREALEMSTLGLVDLQGTEKAIVDQARKLGYDDEAVKNLELLIQSKQIEKGIRGEYKNLEAIKANLESGAQDPRIVNEGTLYESEQALEKLKNNYEAVRKQFTGGEEIYDIFDKSQEELARVEWNRSLKGRKERIDPYAGGIGDVVQSDIFSLSPWEPQHFSGVEKSPSTLAREEIARQKEAGTLDKWNLQERGVGYETSHPLYGAGMSYKQMEPFYEEMDYMYKADGGIMSLKKK